MTSYYAMSNGGSGRVRNLPFNFGDHITYNLQNEELVVLAKALKGLCRLLFMSGATELYPSISGIEPLKSIHDIDKLPNILNRKTTSLMTIHLMSGCPMGEDLSKCAVDSFGKVHGTDGLYISDSSILCEGLGYNPQGTTMAIVRRNALKFLKGITLCTTTLILHLSLTKSSGKHSPTYIILAPPNAKCGKHKRIWVIRSFHN